MTLHSLESGPVGLLDGLMMLGWPWLCLPCLPSAIGIFPMLTQLSSWRVGMLSIFLSPIPTFTQCMQFIGYDNHCGAEGPGK